jgi:RNA polymerase sigma-70 factor (ECF subfamily)
MDETLAARREALENCIEKLDPDCRHLLMQRYAGQDNVHDLAARLGKSANACSLMLHRIRQRLADCVSRALQREAKT